MVGGVLYQLQRSILYKIENNIQQRITQLPQIQKGLKYSLICLDTKSIIISTQTELYQLNNGELHQISIIGLKQPQKLVSSTDKDPQYDFLYHTYQFCDVVLLQADYTYQLIISPYNPKTYQLNMISSYPITKCLFGAIELHLITDRDKLIMMLDLTKQPLEQFEYLYESEYSKRSRKMDREHHNRAVAMYETWLFKINACYT